MNRLTLAGRASFASGELCWSLADGSSGRCNDRRSRGTRRRWLWQRPMRRRRWVDVDCSLGEQSVEDVRIEVERALGFRLSR